MKFNIVLGTAIFYVGLVHHCMGWQQKIEIEDTDRDDVARVCGCSECSNNCYGDYGGTTARVSWKSNIQTAAMYEIGVRYTAGNANDRQLDLYKDSCCQENKRVYRFQIQKTQNWDTWTDEWSAPISLPKGEVTFFLKPVNKGPNVDYVVIRSAHEASTCDVANKEKWCLSRNGPVETTFDDAHTPEMMVPYLVSDHLDLDDITTEIYNSDCKTRSNVVFPGSYKIFKPNPPAGFNTMELYIDLDQTKLLDSTVWKNGNDDDTEGDIRLCVQTDIWWNEDPDNEDPVSVSMVRTIISQHVKLSGSFEINAVTAAEVIDEVYESDADIVYDVEACVCEDDECIDDYVAKINTALNLCIRSGSHEVQIFDVEELLLEQDKDQNKKLSMMAIDDYNSNELTEVEILNRKFDGDNVGEWAWVSTRLVTEWFDEDDPGDIVISGTVDLHFRERRRKVRVRFEKTQAEKIVKKGFELKVRVDEGSGATSLGLLVPAVVALLGFFF